MKKPIRIAGIVCAVVAALLLGMFVVAKVVITPERVKATLTEAAERRLHRPVRIGEIDVRIFSGIVVQGLTIMEKDGAQTFVKVEQVKLNYQFWPLFSKRIVVDEIRLDAPTSGWCACRTTVSITPISWPKSRRHHRRNRSKKGDRSAGIQGIPLQR